MPKISVIVPVYKVEKYLNRCVESILNQTFKDFELILVDDGSPDSCPAICDEYVAKYECIHVIHKENGGLSDARNFGIEWTFNNSDSEYITFIDSDDWVHGRFLEILYSSCVENGVKISSCGINCVKEKVKDIELNDVSGVVGSAESLFDSYKGAGFSINIACGKLYRKELWQSVRFPFGRFHEDAFTTYKLLFQCEKVSFTDKKLYYYFQNEDSIMHKESIEKIIDNLDAYEEQIKFFKLNHYNKLVKEFVLEYLTVLLLTTERNYKNKKYFKVLCSRKNKIFRLYKKEVNIPRIYFSCADELNTFRSKLKLIHYYIFYKVIKKSDTKK